MNAPQTKHIPIPGRRPVALITGATSGIGLEMARQLAARRADLVLVARRAPELEKIAQALRNERGVNVEVITADFAVPGAAAGLFEATRARGLEVDWLVNNAGIGIYGEHTGLDLAAITGMLQLNNVALTELCWLFGREMRARKSGRILNIASTAAYQPSPYFAAYGASKAYVLNFSEALAKEMEDHGVTVSCLSPGPTDTAFFRDVDASGVQASYFGKRGSPAAVAQAGIALMMRGGLSKIVGVKNYLVALSPRFSPRPLAAAIAKRVLSATRADTAAPAA